MGFYLMCLPRIRPPLQLRATGLCDTKTLRVMEWSTGKTQHLENSENQD